MLVGAQLHHHIILVCSHKVAEGCEVVAESCGEVLKLNVVERKVEILIREKQRIVKVDAVQRVVVLGVVNLLILHAVKYLCVPFAVTLLIFYQVTCIVVDV